MKQLPILLAAALLAASPAIGETPHAVTPVLSTAGDSAEEIRSLMTRVADWQLANPSRHRKTDWTQGALYVGMMRWALTSPDRKYMDSLLATGASLRWECSPRPRFHADEHCVGQLHLDAYKRLGDPAMLAGTKRTLDDVIANQPELSDVWGGPDCVKRWSWCDSLFMAPPTFTRLYSVTGDERYLDWAFVEYRKTAAHLFDPENGLFFRDAANFPPDKGGKRLEKNGRRVFWSRGNGWVFAGLANLIPDIPADHPSRAYYTGLFLKMAPAIAKLQQPDGAWHASLLDPASYPIAETSGTAFFVYGLAWGVNQGLLDRATYLPVIEKGWARLAACVHADGKLGYVQPIGSDPRKVTPEMTEVYGVGGFLLAGVEMRRMRLEALAEGRAEHLLTNPEPTLCTRSVTLRLADLGLKPGEPILVLDGGTSAILLSKVNGDTLTVSTPLGAKQTVRCVILRGAKLAGITAGHLAVTPPPAADAK